MFLSVSVVVYLVDLINDNKNAIAMTRYSWALAVLIEMIYKLYALLYLTSYHISCSFIKRGVCIITSRLDRSSKVYKRNYKKTTWLINFTFKLNISSAKKMIQKYYNDCTGINLMKWIPVNAAKQRQKQQEG